MEQRKTVAVKLTVDVQVHLLVEIPLIVVCNAIAFSFCNIIKHCIRTIDMATMAAHAFILNCTHNSLACGGVSNSDGFAAIRVVIAARAHQLKRQSEGIFSVGIDYSATC